MSEKLTSHQVMVMQAIAEIADVSTETTLIIGRSYVTVDERRRYKEHGYVVVYALRTSTHPLVAKGYLKYHTIGFRLTDKGMAYISNT